MESIREVHAKLEKVTITGADDKTDIQEMLDLSAQYPFVEWAILVSAKQEGSYRFPSRTWMDNFVGAATGNNLFISMHLCGRWVREFVTGDMDWNEVPSVSKLAQRIQINTHGERHAVTMGLLDNIRSAPFNLDEIIFQWDGVNDFLTYAAKGYGINATGLFDMSAGAGIVPDKWPKDPQNIRVGYAGGLGPETVMPQLHKIRESAVQDFWIDMERRVRSEDDSYLDMSKVRSVLEQMAQAKDFFKI